MAITGTPSSENPYIVVPENFPAFKDEDAAKRYIKKNWAAVPAAQRERYVLAKVDPDYDIKIIETPIK